MFSRILNVLKSGNLKSTQIFRLAILPQFLAIFRHLHIYLLQNLGADDHFEGQNVSNPNWIKIYDINQKNV